VVDSGPSSVQLLNSLLLLVQSLNVGAVSGADLVESIQASVQLLNMLLTCPRSLVEPWGVSVAELLDSTQPSVQLLNSIVGAPATWRPSTRLEKVLASLLRVRKRCRGRMHPRVLMRRQLERLRAWQQPESIL